jgi:MFS family permease
MTHRQRPTLSARRCEHSILQKCGSITPTGYAGKIPDFGVFTPFLARWASTAELSWVLNTYTIVLGTRLMPAGRLADCYGRKRLFAVGVALFTLASALCGWAVSARALIGFRVLQAVGAALLMPASLALILAVFPREKRSIAVSLCVFAGASARCRTFPASSCRSVAWVPWRWAWSSPVTRAGRARRLRAPSLPCWSRSLASPCGPLESKR